MLLLDLHNILPQLKVSALSCMALHPTSCDCEVLRGHQLSVLRETKTADAVSSSSKAHQKGDQLSLSRLATTLETRQRQLEDSGCSTTLANMYSVLWRAHGGLNGDKEVGKAYGIRRRQEGNKLNGCSSNKCQPLNQYLV